MEKASPRPRCSRAAVISFADSCTTLCVTAQLQSMTFGSNALRAFKSYLLRLFVHHASRDSTASVDDLRFKGFFAALKCKETIKTT